MSKLKEPSGDKHPLSLSPLSFEEVRADLLQVAPPVEGFCARTGATEGAIPVRQAADRRAAKAIGG